MSCFLLTGAAGGTTAIGGITACPEGEAGPEVAAADGASGAKIGGMSCAAAMLRTATIAKSANNNREEKPTGENCIANPSPDIFPLHHNVGPLANMRASLA